MSRVHGKKTVVFIGGVELTQYCNNSQLEISGENHDTTTYGKDAHVFDPGLLNGKATVSGFYDSTVSTGPRAVLRPLVNTMQQFVHRPEGTGSGLPQDSVQVHIEKYTQTHPVADMVTWSVDLQFSDTCDATPQP